ncbi:retrovirus-related pol polyprotein from transposon TNT 1-94 [Tanacetum coccineum]|uniref:Retrovirus-related pol polyprotein from transposon TNT 1-94 n=1 Tax=Tanacetum coccineum TaxID=301880 RepID=A0ABQ5GZA6_9ASTR
MKGMYMSWICILQIKKAMLVSIAQVLPKKMENLNEVRVKELRSDNGTEFINHKLEEFYDEKGISQNFSSPCTPEQNGVAERRNKTLIEASKTMLISCITSKQLWGGEAFVNLLLWLKISGGSTSEDKNGRNDVQPSLTIPPLAVFILQTLAPQDRWLREKHIELVNIIGEPLVGITTRIRIRDSNAASASKCLYVNFLSEMEPKKLIEALEEEAWIFLVCTMKELNRF